MFLFFLFSLSFPSLFIISVIFCHFAMTWITSCIFWYSPLFSSLHSPNTFLKSKSIRFYSVWVCCDRSLTWFYMLAHMKTRRAWALCVVFFSLVQCVSLFYRSLGAFTIPLCFVLLHAFFPLSLSLSQASCCWCRPLGLFSPVYICSHFGRSFN